MSPRFSLFLGKTDIKFSVPKSKGTIQTFTSNRCKTSVMVWGFISVNGMGDNGNGICAMVPLTWRHILGLYRDKYCHQDDVFNGKSMVIRSRQFQVSFCMCYNSGFVDTCGCDWLAIRSVSYWKCMAHHEKENQIVTTTNWWAALRLVSSKMGKKFACETLTISILNSQIIKHCN